MLMSLKRWQTLMTLCQLPPSISCFDALAQAYSEPHRYYHTAMHISAMLHHFDVIKEQANEPHLIELAIWFHDAIYRPFAQDNERASANWAEEFLHDAGLSAQATEKVVELIMATVHDQQSDDPDTQLLIDLDLSILGAEPDTYDNFEQQIRSEYRWVPGIIYRRKRKAILLEFLARDPLFKTDYCQQEFESKARANLTRAVTLLS